MDPGAGGGEGNSRDEGGGTRTTEGDKATLRSFRDRAGPRASEYDRARSPFASLPRTSIDKHIGKLVGRERGDEFIGSPYLHGDDRFLLLLGLLAEEGGFFGCLR